MTARTNEAVAANYIWPVERYEDLTPAQRDCAQDIIEAFRKAMKYDDQNNWRAVGKSQQAYYFCEEHSAEVNCPPQLHMPLADAQSTAGLLA